MLEILIQQKEIVQEGLKDIHEDKPPERPQWFHDLLEKSDKEPWEQVLEGIEQQIELIMIKQAA